MPVRNGFPIPQALHGQERRNEDRTATAEWFQAAFTAIALVTIALASGLRP